MSKKYQIKIINASTENDPVEILIHGPIGKSFWSDDGISGKEFVDAINSIPAEKQIIVGVNSQGGEVGEGLAIFNAIARRKATVTARIDGYALSIASVFPLAAGKIVSPKTSIWMIHNASSFSQEDADGHRKTAELLDKHDMTLVRAYARRTGKSEKEIKAAMGAETWFTGEEAVAYGLADVSNDDTDSGHGVDPSGEVTCPNCGHEECAECGKADAQIECCNCYSTYTAPSALQSIDLTRFKNVPQNLKPLVMASATKPISQPPAGGGNNKNNNIMNKKTILAFLKGMGHELAADATEEQITAALEKVAGSNKNKPDDGISSQLATITAQLAAEKTRRITASIDGFITECRLTKDERESAIKRAAADETYIAELAQRPVIDFGGQPLGHVEIGLTRIEEIKKEPSAAKRFNMLKRDWGDLQRDAAVRWNRSNRGPVTAANTYSSSLITQFLLDGAVTKLQNRWAPLMAFLRDYSEDRYKPLATAQLKFVTAGSTTQTNPTNFESGDSTVTNVAIAVSHYSQAFHVTDAELNEGLRMENLVEINIAGISDKILNVAGAVITNAAFAAPAKYVITPAAFGFSDLQALWGNLKKSPIKNLLLDGEYYARIINQPTYFQRALIEDEPGSYKAFGWDGIYLNTNWTGADAGVRGFACNPQAIGAVAGLPLTPPNIPGATLSESSFQVPGPDISVANYSWFSLATRTMWSSYDLMFGAAALDTTAGQIISSS